MEWNQLIASRRSCVFEATGDSEADHRDQHGDGDHYADHDHEDDDDDDAQSCSCDSWDYNVGSAMEVDDVVDEGDEGEVEDHELEFYNHDWPPASSCCEMGGLFGGLRKERKEGGGEEEEGVVVSNEPGFGSNGLIKMTKEMEDRLFWEMCLATGY